MGNLVTLTIHNDRLYDISNNPVRFVEELVLAASTKSESTTIFGQTKVQGYKHSNVPAVYVQMGNTCCVMDPYDPETLELMKDNKEFFGEMLTYLEQTSAKLRKISDQSR